VAAFDVSSLTREARQIDSGWYPADRSCLVMAFRECRVTVGRVSVVRRGARRRWVVVAAVVLVLVTTPVVVARWPVADLRADPSALRDRILASASVPFQGYVESQGQVTLPNLPQLGDVTGLLSGRTSMRVWHAAAHSWRVAVLDPVGEQDVFQTGDVAFLWSYQHNQWTRIAGTAPARLPRAADVLPPDLARRLLAGSGPQDRLTTLPAQRVAGVTAVGLRLTPADPDTTISRLDVWADPATGLPLRVDVAGIFTSRFLELSRTAPTEDVLSPSFAASSGYTSTNAPDVVSALNATATEQLPDSLAGHDRVPGPLSGVAAYGTGLSRFVVIPVPGRLGRQSLDAVRAAGGAVVPGGFVVHSSVLTLLAVRPAARRTYVLAGFVTPDLLTRAAAELG
jgi:hypothetical protein